MGPIPEDARLWEDVRIEMNAMSSDNHYNLLLRAVPLALALGSALLTGCASLSDARLSMAQVSALSPAPELVANGTAARMAHEYVAAHPGAQIAFGLGDSMLPLYKDGTMIVVEHRPLSQLKAGMTIVYKSSAGWPVAHALVQEVQGGWVTQGLNNPEPDGELVTDENYVGVVVKAYGLASNPMFALADSLSSEHTATLLAKAD